MAEWAGGTTQEKLKCLKLSPGVRWVCRNEVRVKGEAEVWPRFGSTGFVVDH